MYFLRATGMLSGIIREFDTLSPFLVDIHLALCQFHDDIGRSESGIIGEIGADSERTTDLAFAVILYVERFSEVERIAEDYCLGG